MSVYRKTLPLPDLPLPLVVEWAPGWNNLTLWYEGEAIGVVPEKAALLVGQTIHLPDGQAVIVVLRDPDLEVWYKGRDLVSGVATGTRDLFADAVKGIRVIGYTQLLVVPVYLAAVPPPYKWPLSLLVAVWALVLIFLGYRVKARQYKTAVYLALAGCIFIVPLFGMRGVFKGLFSHSFNSLVDGLHAELPRFTERKSADG